MDGKKNIGCLSVQTVYSVESTKMHSLYVYTLYTLLGLAKLTIGQSQCKVPTCDAVLLVDGTSAVGAINFQKTKDFLVSLMKRFTISLTGSRIGLVQFTPMARPEFYFKHFIDEARVEQAIALLPYEPCQNVINCYGSDDWNFSLPYAAELALTEGAGNRANIPDVIIVITTGHQNQKSNISTLNNVFHPLSRRLIYVVAVGDVSQVAMLPGAADVVQAFHVDNFDKIFETEEVLCASVKAGLEGLNGSKGNDPGGGNGGINWNGNNGDGGNSGSGSGNGGSGGNSGNNGGSGSGNNGNGSGGSGTNVNGGSSGNGNGPNSGSGSGSGSGSSGSGGGGNGSNGNGSNGSAGSGSNGSGGNSGNNGNGSGSGSGSGSPGTGSGSGTNSNSGSGSGSSSGSGSGTGSNGNNGNSGSQSDGISNGANSNHAADGSVIIGNSQNGNSTGSVATASISGGTLGILILLIVLALIAFLILAYCLYRKRQENNRLMINVQELRTAKTQAEQDRVQNRQGLAKGVQVVRGTTGHGSTSLSNVRLNGNGEQSDYYRVNNDRQRLLGGNSEDPNFVAGQRGADPMRDTRWPEGGPPHGTHWAPPKDSELAGGKLRDGRGLDGLELENVEAQNQSGSDRIGAGQFRNDRIGGDQFGTDGNGADQSRKDETGVGIVVGEGKRIQGQFRRKRSDDIELGNRRSSLPSINSTGTFKRKVYANGESNSLEGDGKRGSEAYSDPVVTNGRFGRKRTHIPVKKQPTMPPDLPYVDLLFVVDNSGSIGNANFEKVKSFLRAVAGEIDVTAEGSRIGCIMFNQEPLLMFGFDKYLSTPYILGALERLTYMGGGTFSGRALQFASDVFKVSTLPPSKKPPLLIGLSPRQQIQAVQAAQTVHHRPPPPPQQSKLYDHPRINVIVFVSDGVTEDHIEEVSENLRMSGVHLAAVSVKGHQQDALLLITRDPKSIFSLDDHRGVSEWIEERRRAAKYLVVPTLSPGERR